MEAMIVANLDHARSCEWLLLRCHRPRRDFDPPAFPPEHACHDQRLATAMGLSHSCDVGNHYDINVGVFSESLPVVRNIERR